MKKELIDLLACPACAGDLELQPGWREASSEIETGLLGCSACGRSYCIVRGVPRFVRDDDYVGNFSLEWQLHRATQLDSCTGRDTSHRAFFEKTGLTPEELRGKRVLDVGCGAGRFLEIAAQYAETAVGVDLSYAVDSAHATLCSLPNVHVAQASVFELPFKRESFDIVFSLGVLHHTPDTRRAFLAMVPFVRAGGDVALWVYWSGIESMYSDLLRHATVRVPPRLLYAGCRAVVPWARGWRFRGPRRQGIFGRLLISTSPYEDEAILDTFDWYSPRYQWKHDWDQVRSWLVEAGLTDVVRLDFPVSYRARRPQERAR